MIMDNERLRRFGSAEKDAVSNKPRIHPVRGAEQLFPNRGTRLAEGTSKRPKTDTGLWAVNFSKSPRVAG